MMLMFANIRTGQVEVTCEDHAHLYPIEGQVTEEERFLGRAEFAPYFGPVEFDVEPCDDCFLEGLDPPEASTVRFQRRLFGWE